MLLLCQQAEGPASKSEVPTKKGTVQIMRDEDEEIGDDVAAVLERHAAANKEEQADARRHKAAVARSKKMAADDPDVHHNPFEVCTTQQRTPFCFVLTYFPGPGYPRGVEGGAARQEQ